MPPNWNGPQPAPRALWVLVSANFPQARNLGIYNRRNIAGTNTASLHAEGRALDIGLLASDTSEKGIADQLFQAFVDLGAQLGLQEVIWNRQIWSSSRPAIRPYTGARDHRDHIHVGFTRQSSQQTSFPSLAMRIATLRTGLEDLNDAFSNFA